MDIIIIIIIIVDSVDRITIAIIIILPAGGHYHNFSWTLSLSQVDIIIIAGGRGEFVLDPAAPNLLLGTQHSGRLTVTRFR